MDNHVSKVYVVKLFLFIIMNHEYDQLKNAILQDIQTLLENYMKRETLSLQIFKAVWEDIKFHLIHYACEDHIHGREIFIEYIYEQLISFYMNFKNVQGKIAVIYSLYFLYETQPTQPCTYPIPVTLEFWMDLSRFCSHLLTNENDYRDILFVINEIVNIKRNEMIRFVSSSETIDCNERMFPFDESKNSLNDLKEIENLERQVIKESNSLPNIHALSNEYSEYLDIAQKLELTLNNDPHLLSELESLSNELDNEKSSIE